MLGWVNNILRFMCGGVEPETYTTPNCHATKVDMVALYCTLTVINVL